MNHKENLFDLLHSIQSFGNAHGEGVIAAIEQSASPLLMWLDILKKFAITGHATELLDAIGAAIREAAALAAIGAARPCLFSLRAQIDLILAWIYFKDHPIEYAVVKRTGEGFRLKKEVISYMKESFVGYGEKMGILAQAPVRKEIDPYKLLSAHIHAQSSYVIPKINNLRDVIAEKSIVDDCISIQADVSEYISDQLFASGIIGYKSLSQEFIDSLKLRAFSPAQLSVLFS